MKKKVLKQIRDVAQHMPAHFVEGKMKVGGDEIIAVRRAKAIEERKRFVHPIDSTGEEVDPKKVYSFNIDVRINHARRMKRLYNSGGIKAVRVYVESVIAASDSATVDHLNMLSSMPQMSL